MSQDLKKINKILKYFESISSFENFALQVSPLKKEEIDKLDHIPYKNYYTQEGVDNRLEYLEKKGVYLEYITGKKQFNEPESLRGNTENFIGMAQVPIGLAGPLLINGTLAMGDFYVPLATTEGAMVASYNRGMKASRLCGGISSVCLAEGTQRSPFFKFKSIGEIGIFMKWLIDKMKIFDQIISENSNHTKLEDVKTNVEGNSVILTFEYTTGDASGQNMVTICTDKICKYILENSPIKPLEWYIEGNYSGDKKATAVSFTSVRGKKVAAEALLSKEVVEKILRTTPEKMANYWQASTLGVIQSGAYGAQGHVANGLTALFIACGQDVACISESSLGITRMEIDSNGDLYVSLTLPSLIVGTIGGGTGLPTQKESLEMLGCYGTGNARKFAEVCCAVALAGEISIAAAISADQFTKAHKIMGRKK